MMQFKCLLVDLSGKDMGRTQPSMLSFVHTSNGIVGWGWKPKVPNWEFKASTQHPHRTPRHANGAIRMAARPNLEGLHCPAAALRSQCPVSLVGVVCALTVCIDIVNENQWFLVVHDCTSASHVINIWVLWKSCLKKCTRLMEYQQFYVWMMSLTFSLVDLSGKDMGRT